MVVGMLALLSGWRGYAITLALGMAAGWVVQGWRWDADSAARDRDQAQAMTDAVQLARLTEQARWSAQLEKLNAARKRETAALADAAAADAAAVQLRKKLTHLERCAADPAVAGCRPRKQDTDTVGLLAELYSRMEADGRTISNFADTVKNTGLACEDMYDGL